LEFEGKMKWRGAGKDEWRELEISRKKKETNPESHWSERQRHEAIAKSLGIFEDAAE
jgi:predicted transcriptional regulator